MKTTFDYFKYLFLCIVVCAFTACSDDDDEGNSSAVIEIADQYKTITCTGADNDAIEITFTAKNDWTALPSHSWIDLSKRSGSAGDQTIIVSIDDNEEFKTRIGTITLKDKVSGKTVDIIVTQGEKNSYFTFTSVKGESKENGILIINNEQQMITDTVNIASNYEYSVAVDVNWLSYKKVNTNADGSAKYVFYADPAKLYEAAGYEEETATVSFEYQAATRVPATKTYQVKFAGITPKIEADASPVVLEDNGENYMATVHIVSNMVWDMGNKLTFANSEYSGSGNKSKQYFEAETSITFTYNKAELQIEEETENLTFIDAEKNVLNYSVNVIYPGVGEEYVYLDNTAFNLGDNRMHTFEAFGEPDPDNGPGMYKDLSLNFQVKAAHKDKIEFYLIKQQFAGAPIYKTLLDSWGDEASTNMTGYQGWGFVEDLETNLTRTNVETVTKTLYVRSRGNEWNGSSKEDEERYFAFLAVSSTKYPTFESLFDEDGNLKSELEGKYVFCSQKASSSVTDFECPDLKDKTIQVGAQGETLTFQYFGLDLNAEKWGASWTYGDIEVFDGKLTSEPENWGTGEMIKSSDFGEYDPVEGTGKITIIVAPNTTGKERTENFAIFAGMPEFNNAVFTYFTINQAAE